MPLSPLFHFRAGPKGALGQERDQGFRGRLRQSLDDGSDTHYIFRYGYSEQLASESNTTAASPYIV